MEQLKKLLIKMNKVEYISKKELSSEQKELTPKITQAALALFMDIKREKVTYTLDDNKVLRKYRINDGDSEPDYRIIQFFEGNSNALYEMISYKLCGKNKKSYNAEYHLFHMSLFSNLCDKEYDVFFASRNGKFYLYTNELTDMLLLEYVSKYFTEVDYIEKLESLHELNKNEHEFIQKELNSIAEELYKNAKNKGFDFLSGAITFMDFLGWKGLWQNHEGKNHEGKNHLEKVSGLIGKINLMVEKYSTELFPYSEGIEISKLISISDTIAIFTPYIYSIGAVDLLELHAKIASYILEECVKETYPIRGAIGYGQYNTKDNIMIGPGIDECASWHETCNWIGVHLTPSAELIMRSQFKKGENSHNTIIEYPVPVKNGYPKVKYCVSWFVSEEQFINLTQRVQALLPEISSKYMNTFEFLERKEGGYDGKNGVDKK